MPLLQSIGPTGIKYTATDLRFGLPMHEHHRHIECHTVECLVGRIAVFFDQYAVELWPGDVLPVIDCAVRHGVTPLEAPATWFARWPLGWPAWAEALSESERNTALDSWCDLPGRFAHQFQRRRP